MRVHTLFLAAVVAFGGMVSTPASATSQVLLTDAEHAHEAHVVVHGAVVDQKVALDPQLGRPLTLSQIQVTDVLYGEAPAELVVEQLGGTWGDDTLRIAGDARMKPGEEVVLFLTKRQGVWMMTAMEQSKYSVEPSIDGPTLQRELTSGFFLRGPQGALKQIPTPHNPGVLLEDMKKLLSELDKGGE